LPTIMSAVIPIPKSWEEFEDITLSALKIRWSSPNLTRHGRQGQKQDGVDLYGDDDLGRNVGVQCKLTQVDAVGVDVIRAEIAKAENFQPALRGYYMAISAPSDANLQKQVRVLSKERVEQGKFPVGLLFWDDIVQDLKKNKDVFKMHYPELLIDSGHIPAASRPQGNRGNALLDLGYLGLHLDDWLGLLFGEFMDEQRAAQDFERLISSLEEASKVVCDGDAAAELAGALQELRSYVHDIVQPKEQTADWRPANRLAARIMRSLETLEYQLEGKELLIFKIGHGIAIWEFHDLHTAKDYPRARQNTLLEYISGLSPNRQVSGYIQGAVEAYNADDAAFSVKAHTPDSLYGGVKRLLLLG